MQSEQSLIEINIGNPATFHDELEAAVATVQAEATSRRQGILVTRHTYTRFTVGTSHEVPFRTTMERCL